MSELREVPPKTPIADFVEKIPKVGPPIARVMRAARPFWRRRHEKRVQDEIDKRYHDKLRNGQPEGE